MLILALQGKGIDLHLIFVINLSESILRWPIMYFMAVLIVHLTASRFYYSFLINDYKRSSCDASKQKRRRPVASKVSQEGEAFPA